MPRCHYKSFSPLLNPQDILEGGNLRVPLQELHQMILTPIKAYCSQTSSPEEHGRDADSHHPPSLLGSDSQGSDCKDSAAGGMQQHHLPGCEGESGGAPLPEGDLPGQFTRVMGKGEWVRGLLGVLSAEKLGPRSFLSPGMDAGHQNAQGLFHAGCRVRGIALGLTHVRWGAESCAIHRAVVAGLCGLRSVLPPLGAI